MAGVQWGISTKKLHPRRRGGALACAAISPNLRAEEVDAPDVQRRARTTAGSAPLQGTPSAACSRSRLGQRSQFVGVDDVGVLLDGLGEIDAAHIVLPSNSQSTA